MFKRFLLAALLLCSSVALSQEPLWTGKVYASLQVSCDTFECAEILAVSFLVRQKPDTKYKYSAGILVFAPIRTIAFYKNKETKEIVFIVEVIGENRKFIVSRIPALDKSEEKQCETGTIPITDFLLRPQPVLIENY